MLPRKECNNADSRTSGTRTFHPTILRISRTVLPTYVSTRTTRRIPRQISADERSLGQTGNALSGAPQPFLTANQPLAEAVSWSSSNLNWCAVTLRPRGQAARGLAREIVINLNAIPPTHPGFAHCSVELIMLNYGGA